MRPFPVTDLTWLAPVSKHLGRHGRVYAASLIASAGFLCIAAALWWVYPPLGLASLGAVLASVGLLLVDVGDRRARRRARP